MTTPKQPSKPAAKKPTFAAVGRSAAIEAQRKVLLAELRAQSWNLTSVARELGLSNASNVIKAIRRVGLSDEYEAARSRGEVAPGRPA